ncbi:hypothetical protein DPMN_088392 [Dreissena polymorpha]|uniref:Uncharacterized protein n=1 Tax=Dreissena polymorpha TaxID=45954 RepID=A0A9D4KU16_DREPO|nr:hypothetical protein DPMN_088392 [Dreissena polymorpha]
MGRRPRNILPTSCELLKPRTRDPYHVKAHFDTQKQTRRYTDIHDRRKGAKDLKPLQERANVRMSGGTKHWKLVLC